MKWHLANLSEYKTRLESIAWFRSVFFNGQIKRGYWKRLLTGAWLAVASLQCCALDEHRLWLPQMYQGLFLELKNAALVAEKQEMCKEVLKGTLDIEQSNEDVPAFRIQCRRPDGLSYNQMIYGAQPKMPTAKELEQMENWYREKCFDAFEKATKLMMKKSNLFEQSVAPAQLEDDKAVFVLNFDAQDIHGQPLKYKAVCQVGLKQKATVDIAPRRP